MKEGPDIAAIGALIGDPARANMLTALMSGRALTASELAAEAGVSAQTASSHLRKLQDAGLLKLLKQGRHRYYSLSGDNVAQTLEGLMGLGYEQELVEAKAGDVIGITLDEPIYVERGDLGSLIKTPPMVPNVFRTSLFWSHEALE